MNAAQVAAPYRRLPRGGGPDRGAPLGPFDTPRRTCWCSSSRWLPGLTLRRFCSYAPGAKRPRQSLIAGVGVLIFTIILADVAVTAHTTSEPEPEWLMVMNAETGDFQHAGEAYTLMLDGVDEE